MFRRRSPGANNYIYIIFNHRLRLFYSFTGMTLFLKFSTVLIFPVSLLHALFIFLPRSLKNCGGENPRLVFVSLSVS